MTPNRFLVIWRRDRRPLNDADNVFMNSAARHDIEPGLTMWRTGEPPHVSGDLTLVFDGRLDDHARLCDDLDLMDDTCDAELICAAYRRWGASCPAHLIGDFCAVLWDGDQRKLVAFRDAMGARTLNLHEAGPLIMLSDDLRPIAYHPDVPDTYSRKGLWLWVMNLYDETQTLYETIQGLPTNETWLIDQDGLVREPNWSFGDVKTLRYQRDVEYRDHLRELLDQSVADRLRNVEGAVGSMMSGGMDSTTVTALAHRHLCKTDIPLLPFSFRFETLKDCDESPFSQALADVLGLDVNWVDCEQFWVLQGLYEPRKTKPETPFYIWNTMDAHILARLQDRSGTVLLTGHGGDSLFTGLPTTLMTAAALRRGDFKALQRFGPLKPISLAVHLAEPLMPAGLRRKIAKRRGMTNPIPAWISLESHQEYLAIEAEQSRHPKVFRELDRQRLFELAIPVSAGIRRVIHWYRKFAAPFGVDVRHPLYDRRLAEFILAIPPEQLRAGGHLKGLLREAMTGRLPERIIHRQDKPTLAGYYRYGFAKEQINIFNFLSKHNKLQIIGLDSINIRKYCNSYIQNETEASSDFWGFLISANWIEPIP